MMPAPERCSDFPNEFCDHCFDFVFSLFFDLPEFISAKLSFRIQNQLLLCFGDKILIRNTNLSAIAFCSCKLGVTIWKL
ncbi:Uncharacterized protein TCM_005723 [Theobroma cacao]|uniref:Uncharacterized protein n=1 Tax=Theobroma cacao TaxID=3641 RepID=A0A061DUK8_THECC|nr:Uncharacterized protein TCM_005723 [Theobroma cacao]